MSDHITLPELEESLIEVRKYVDKKVENGENGSGSSETYELPIAGEETLGGVKIGDGLSITDEGVLSADAQPYELPKATAEILGGVKVGDGLSVDTDGVLSSNAQNYELPKATSEVLGGIKIGGGLVVDDDGVVSTAEGSELPIATETIRGVIKVGDGLTITEDGVLSANEMGVSCGSRLLVTTQSPEFFGKTVKLTNSEGTEITSTFSDSGRCLFTGILFSGSCVVSCTYNDRTVSASVSFGSYFGSYEKTLTYDPSTVVTPGETSIVDVPVATSSKLGGIKVGDRLSITSDGMLSAIGGGYGNRIEVVTPSSQFYNKTVTLTSESGDTITGTFSSSGQCVFTGVLLTGTVTVSCTYGSKTVKTLVKLSNIYFGNYTVSLVYSDSTVYSFIIDHSVSGGDPYEMVSYADGASVFTPGSDDLWLNEPFNLIKPCVLQYGEVLYYLDPNDFTKRVDGQDADISTYGKDVMIEFPKFGVKSTWLDDNRLMVSLALGDNENGFDYTAYSASRVNDCDKIYLSVFRSEWGQTETADDMLRAHSIYNESTLGMTGYVMQTHKVHTINGDGYYPLGYAQYQLIQCLSILFYKHLSLVTALGPGAYQGSYYDRSGQGLQKGMNASYTAYKQASGTLTGNSVKLFGIESLADNTVYRIFGVRTEYDNLISSNRTYIAEKADDFIYENQELTGYTNTLTNNSVRFNSMSRPGGNVKMIFANNTRGNSGAANNTSTGIYAANNGAYYDGIGLEPIRNGTAYTLTTGSNYSATSGTNTGVTSMYAGVFGTPKVANSNSMYGRSLYTMGWETNNSTLQQTRLMYLHKKKLTSTPSIVSFSSGTDEQIMLMLQAHYEGRINIQNYWNVGDTRTINLSASYRYTPNNTTTDNTYGIVQAAQTVQIVLVNKGGKTLENGKECAFVWQVKDVLNNTDRFHTGTSNIMNWKGTNLRKNLMWGFWYQLPIGFRRLCKWFKCETNTSNSTNTETTVDIVALPSVEEITDSSSGKKWTYYTSRTAIKYLYGGTSANPWWLRSPHTANTTQWYYITNAGALASAGASTYYGIAPFGCI